MSQCHTYLSTVTGAEYTEPNGTQHEVSIHDLWYYNVTAGTTTWVMTLPRSKYNNGWHTPDQGLSSTGIANTKTKFWTLNYDWSVLNKLYIREYDIDQNDPTILTYCRDINLHPLTTNPTTGVPYGIYPSFFTAIDNKTLIMCRDNGPGINPGDMVFELDITPGITSSYGGVIVDAVIKDKFTFALGHIPGANVNPGDTTKAGGDVIYVPSENAIYTNHAGLGHILNKYDYCDGTLITGTTAGSTWNGLSMYQGNIYGYKHAIGIGSTALPERFLLNKITCVETYINDVDIPNPYSTGGVWQTTLTDIPAGITLGGTVTYTETFVTNASSSPCCDLELTNCGGCASNLIQELTHPYTGGQTPINYIPYSTNILFVQPGDCVNDPADGCCRCCTYRPVPFAPPTPQQQCTSPNGGQRWLAMEIPPGSGGAAGNYMDVNIAMQWHVDNPTVKFGDVYFKREDNLNANNGLGECYFGNPSVASVLGTHKTFYRVTFEMNTQTNGHVTFDGQHTWNDIITYCQSIGISVTNSTSFLSFKTTLAAISAQWTGTQSSCGCTTGSPAAQQSVGGAPAAQCQIINGQYIDVLAEWKDCGVNVNGNSCIPNAFNWGCKWTSGWGPHNGVPGLFGAPNFCDMNQINSATCPSCNKIDTGWVGRTSKAFMNWWTTLSNGFHNSDVSQHKYILYERVNHVASACFENGLGWWKSVYWWIPPTGSPIYDWLLYVNGLPQGSLLPGYTVWNDFLTDIYGSGVGPLSATTAVINGTNYFLGTYSELQQLNYTQLMEAINDAGGGDLLLMDEWCACDFVECIQDVPAPGGWLTKELCEASPDTPGHVAPGTINPHTNQPFVSEQSCCHKPWVCKLVGLPHVHSALPYLKQANSSYACVQQNPTSATQVAWATKDQCENADNNCNSKSYNCIQSISDCGGRDLLPHIVGLYWDDIQLIPTNSLNAVPVTSNVELFANPIFGLQNVNISEVRWENTSLSLFWPMCIAQSQLALSNWPNPGWGVFTGKYFKEPFETGNINNNIQIPGLPVYTWSDYIDVLNSYGFGQQLTLLMTPTQVGQVITNWMGWSSTSFGMAVRPCECDPNTVICACVDPGDGTGQHGSLYGCENNIINCCGDELFFSASTAGCMDPTAQNYNPLATPPLGNYTSCIYCVYGCTDSNSPFYNPNATCPCDLIGTGPGNNECCGTLGTCEIGNVFREVVREWYYPLAGINYSNVPSSTHVWTSAIENVLEVVIIGVSDEEHVSNGGLQPITIANSGPITHVVGGGPPTAYANTTANPTPDGAYFPICSGGEPSPDMLSPGGVGINGTGTAQNPNYYVDFNGNILGGGISDGICHNPIGSCYCSSAAPWGAPVGYGISCCRPHPQIQKGIQCFTSVQKIHIENTWLDELWIDAWNYVSGGPQAKLAIFSQNIDLKRLMIIGNRGVDSYLDLRPNNNLEEVIITTGMFGCTESSPGPDVLNTHAYYWGFATSSGSGPSTYPGQIVPVTGCREGLLGLDVSGLSNLKLLDIGHRQYYGKHSIGTNHDFSGLQSLEELNANSSGIQGHIDLSGNKPNLRKINFNNNGVSGVVDLSGTGPDLEYVGFYKNNVTEIYLNSSVDLDVLRQLGQPGGYQNFRVGCNGPNACAPGSTVILVHVGTQARANYANGWSTLTHNVIPGSGFYGTQQAHFVP